MHRSGSKALDSKANPTPQSLNPKAKVVGRGRCPEAQAPHVEVIIRGPESVILFLELYGAGFRV